MPNIFYTIIKMNFLTCQYDLATPLPKTLQGLPAALWMMFMPGVYLPSSFFTKLTLL